ncbi:hypothetical protein NC652_041479 [Populus alba x Populus x berolinensis]|nr:hypothetical protein NC652_041479 [Populus alba x Populus x berolinensis]
MELGGLFLCLCYLHNKDVEMKLHVLKKLFSLTFTTCAHYTGLHAIIAVMLTMVQIRCSHSHQQVYSSIVLGLVSRSQKFRVDGYLQSWCTMHSGFRFSLGICIWCTVKFSRRRIVLPVQNCWFVVLALIMGLHMNTQTYTAYESQQQPYPFSFTSCIILFLMNVIVSSQCKKYY